VRLELSTGQGLSNELKYVKIDRKKHAILMKKQGLFFMVFFLWEFIFDD
jgi:hypothetical protein